VDFSEAIELAVAEAIAARDGDLMVDERRDVVSVDQRASVREYAGDPFILDAIMGAADGFRA